MRHRAKQRRIDMLLLNRVVRKGLGKISLWFITGPAQGLQSTSVEDSAFQRKIGPP